MADFIGEIANGTHEEETLPSGSISGHQESEILDHVKDLALELQRLAQISNCPELAAMLASAAAEAHHQSQLRKH